MPADVFILTTEGPVRIQRITEEDCSLRSVICQDGRTEILPVSAEYDDFVREPVGVIERMTGHPVYRMDVEGSLSDGRSWQLAAFLAHALRASGQGVPKTIFATGEVDRDLNVRPVKYVTRKIDALDEVFPALGVDPGDAVVFVPVGTDEPGLPPSPVRLLAIGSIGDALSELGLNKAVLRRSRPSGRSIAMWNRRSFKYLAGSILILLLVFFAAVQGVLRWDNTLSEGRLVDLEKELARASEGTFGSVQVRLFRRWLAARRPSPDVLKAWASARFADGQICSEGQGAMVDWSPSKVGGQMTLCVFQVQTEAPGYKTTGRLALWPDGLQSNGNPERNLRGSARPDGRTWSLKFNKILSPGAVVRHVRVVGRSQPRGAQPWNAVLVREPINSPAFVRAKTRLEDLGYLVTIKDYPLN